MVVSDRVEVSSSMVVDMLNVVTVPVTLATKVSMINCEGPGISVVMLMLVTVVPESVSKLVFQAQYSKTQVSVPLSKALQIL